MAPLPEEDLSYQEKVKGALKELNEAGLSVKEFGETMSLFSRYGINPFTKEIIVRTIRCL